MSNDRFLENMGSYGLGNVVGRMATLQDKIVAAVRDSGLQGKLNLALTFKRAGSRAVAVSAKITPTIPELPIQTVEMYVDDNNHLHEEDPDQMTTDDVIKPDFGTKTVNQV